MTSFNPLAGVNPSDPFGIRTDFGGTSSDAQIDGRPRKKKHDEEVEFKTDYQGVNGYVYSAKYRDGKVVLCVNCGDDEIWGIGGSHHMSIKNWRLFRTVVGPDLDQTGFPDMLYASQWYSPTGPELYRVEADRYNRPTEEFIFLSVCEDRERVIASRGVESWRLNPYPTTKAERMSWFKDLFFIQWADWRAVQRMFKEVDAFIKRDKLNKGYENVRKRLVFDDFTLTTKTAEPSALCRPKIIRLSDY
ncbi:uncharacterized protein LOC115793630 isoform X1 [Archocentrus centrarchus]|uniref:uncharacterized protein LOC115793630 isoform X1 n=1 Tax=Archocentrus centrarchus TaxID=63155 RepID=UPI0011EA1E5B|nr:uncharacterized protein LOC115793630 isoform X1 [Archocentrus centrarchus]